MRISSSVDGLTASPSAAASFATSSLSSPRTSASTTVPSSFVIGIAFEVAATSMSRNLASSSQVTTPGVSTSCGAASGSGKTGGRGTACATSRSAAKSPFSQVTSVFSPDPDGARKSIDSLPPIIPDSACTSKYSTPQRWKILWYAASCARKLRSRPSSSRSKEYESFMMNSRTRSRPPRGRGSSRSLV